jgi:indolepyruvate ferredoxin oxidoreductase alpha subunit
VRPPVLCAGCPHRASFFAVKEAAKGRKAVFTGDIGCYTLGNAQPLDMVDTCLCMGAGITVAQGLKRVEADTVHFAFIGDSTFFHGGITGVINAVYNQTDIIVVVLDNSTTAMTGNQPHPGTGVTMMKTQTKKINIEKLVMALNVSKVIRINPFDQKAAKDAVRTLMEQKGVRVLLFEAPCIAISKPAGKMLINTTSCTGCQLCIKKLGCPAISFVFPTEPDHFTKWSGEGSPLVNGKAVINSGLCTGCGLCASVCAADAISGGKQ